METFPAERVDSISRVIHADPDVIFEAFTDPLAISSWRPPEGMSCRIYHFDPVPHGTYRMSFIYNDPAHAVPGKSAENADTFSGTFLELEPGRKIVEEVLFDSEDPEFSQPMRITTTLDPDPSGGTRVTFSATQVPDAIRQADHLEGMDSSLKNLEKWLERHAE